MSPLPSRDPGSLALLTDLNQLTMASGYFRSSLDSHEKARGFAP